MKVIKTDLSKFNQLKAKENAYYIDEVNNLIARMDTFDSKADEDFRNFYTNININITSVYDLFDLNNKNFVIFDYTIN